MVDLAYATGITFDYPGVRALDGVDFSVRAGELVCLLGPNGSGKSTLLRVLAGLADPSDGTVSLGGRPSRGMSSRDRARTVAVVPQGLPRIPSLHVRDFVLGGRYAHLGLWRAARAEDFAAVEDALQRVDAMDCADRLLVGMSGGQRQRVLIARALAQGSDLVLFDEPTASLDPEHQLLVMDLVVDLVAKGCGVAVVTHDFNLASQYADRIVMLDEGRIAAAGPVDDVLRREVLEPVYGSRLWFGALPGDPGRPLVISWRD